MIQRLLFFIILITQVSHADERFAINVSNTVESTEKSEVIYEKSLSKHEEASRNSSVRVSTRSDKSFGSGSYVKISNFHIVITAEHVVDGHDSMLVHGRDGEIVIGKVVYVNKKIDIAAISVPEMKSRDPIKFKQSKSDKESLIGQKVVYTGFPDGHDLLTIRGEIAGIAGSGMMIMHSYTWMGASGSGVFDSNGTMIGILVAVDVSRYYVPQIVEDIVYITPIVDLDVSAMITVIEKASILE